MKVRQESWGFTDMKNREIHRKTGKLIILPRAGWQKAGAYTALRESFGFQV